MLQRFFLLLFLGQYIPLEYTPERKNITLLEVPEKVVKVDIGTHLDIPATSSVLLNCPVNIYDLINVKWEKDKEIFRGTRRHNDGTVLVTNLNANHSGRYICYNDDYSRYEFGSLYLNILCKTIIFLIETLFCKKPTKVLFLKVLGVFEFFIKSSRLADVEVTVHVSVINTIEKHVITRMINLIFKSQVIFFEKKFHSLKTIEVSIFFVIQ